MRVFASAASRRALEVDTEPSAFQVEPPFVE